MTEKIYLNILADQLQQVSVYGCERLEAIYSFYSKKLDLAKKITI